jgi:hypothetical protein
MGMVEKFLSQGSKSKTNPTIRGKWAENKNNSFTCVLIRPVLS